VKPSYLLKELEFSRHSHDIKQYKQELDAYDAIKKLDIFFALYNYDKESFKHSFFMDSYVIKNLFSIEHHLLIKYFRAIDENNKVNILKFFADNLIEQLRYEKVVRLKFFDSLDELIDKLVWLLIRNEKYSYADDVLNEYMSYLKFLETYLIMLNEQNNKLNSTEMADKDSSKKIILLSKFNTYCKMILIKNHLHDFKSSYDIYEKADEMVQDFHKSTFIHLIKFT
jgi:hypothetical protein